MPRTRKLESLGNLLLRYKTHLKAPQGAVLEAFVRTAARHGISLKKSECRYNASARILSVVTPGPMKMEVLMKKKILLEGLLSELGQKSAPKDIL